MLRLTCRQQVQPALLQEKLAPLLEVYLAVKALTVVTLVAMVGKPSVKRVNSRNATMISTFRMLVYKLQAMLNQTRSSLLLENKLSPLKSSNLVTSSMQPTPPTLRATPILLSISKRTGTLLAVYTTKSMRSIKLATQNRRTLQVMDIRIVVTYLVRKTGTSMTVTADQSKAY